MWKEWLERTLTRSVGDAPRRETRLFDVDVARLPVLANSNDPTAPPPIAPADAGDCIEAQ